MKLVLKDSVNWIYQSPTTVNRNLLGPWAGTVWIDSKPKAVKLSINLNGTALSSKLDIVSEKNGIDITSIALKDAHFDGTFSYRRRPVKLALTFNGSTLVGSSTAKLSGGAGFVKLANPSIETMRSYEGLYKDGSHYFSCEVLNPTWGLTLTELPSGQVRVLFPVSNREFVAGPKLMCAFPAERRISFALNHIIIREGGRVRVAPKVPLVTRDVTFRDGPVTLGGSLVLPMGRGRHPGIVVISRREDPLRTTFMGQGYWFAHLGYAVLKYDRRGSGQSSGPSTKASNALAADGAAAAAYLASQPEVDSRRVGFFGIGEGAAISNLAGTMYKPVSFVVAVNGGEPLRNLKCSVLQFAGRTGSTPIELKGAGNGGSQVFWVSKANRNMFEAQSSEEGEVPLCTRFAPGYLSPLTQWLTKLNHA